MTNLFFTCALTVFDFSLHKIYVNFTQTIKLSAPNIPSSEYVNSYGKTLHDICRPALTTTVLYALHERIACAVHGGDDL